MKILHMLDERWDSGITQYALEAAKIQREHGNDIMISVLRGRPPEKMAQQMGLKTHAVESFGDRWALLSDSSIDIVNAHSGPSHTCAVLKRKVSGAKAGFAIVRTRGDAREVPINFRSRFIYRNTDAVIAASDHIRNQYQEGFGFSEDRVRTIYPFVTPDEAPQIPPQGRIGILGRLDPVKGHSVFIEAAALVLRDIPDIQFHIAGKEANVSYELLKNQARSLGILDHLIFHGFYPDAREFMRSCQVGVISSIGSEEVSRACLEWMSSGRPVVGTLVGCLSELIEPEETGLLVPPGDSAALADGIRKLIRNPDQAFKWGCRAHEITLSRFSRDAHWKETETLYDMVLNQNNRR